jgi:hypothetical protein
LVPVFAELHFAGSLKSVGVNLISRAARTYEEDQGPDLSAEDPRAWIEVVAPQRGCGENKLNEDFGLSAEKFILRLRNSIKEKAAQLKTYAADEKHYIKKGDISVIALSGAFLQPYDSMPGVPFIVQAVLGVGDLGLLLEEKTATL